MCTIAREAVGKCLHRFAGSNYTFERDVQAELEKHGLNVPCSKLRSFFAGCEGDSTLQAKINYLTAHLWQLSNRSVITPESSACFEMQRVSTNELRQQIIANQESNEAFQAQIITTLSIMGTIFLLYLAYKPFKLCINRILSPSMRKRLPAFLHTGNTNPAFVDNAYTSDNNAPRQGEASTSILMENRDDETGSPDNPGN